MTIGLVLCSCGETLKETLDYSAIAKSIENKDAKILQTSDLCLTEGLKQIKDFITKEHIDRLVIAACTPQSLEKKIKSTVKGVIFEFACIREHCAWPHLHEKADATQKAIILINSALEYVSKKANVEKQLLNVNRSVTVIGGGISGISAAIELKNNAKVYLIEKSPQLGGNLNNIFKLFPNSADPVQVLTEKIAQLKTDNNIEILTNSKVTSITGKPGDYTLTIDINGGSIHTINTGAVILATGFEECPPDQLNLGYPSDCDIITQTHLSQILKNGEVIVPSTGKKAQNVVMINCVGSRCADHFYCSKICCTYSIHNAIHLIDQGIDTTIIYMDIRTPYKYENLYREAREKGVKFIRGNTQSIEIVNGTKSIIVEDTLQGNLVELNPDLIVLSTALIPSQGTQELAELFQLPLKQSLFISDLYGKTNSAQTMMKGIYIAGSAQFPMNITDSISHASAAAMKAVKFTNQKQLEIDNEVTTVNEDLCIGCGNCEEVCLYHAAKMEVQSETENEIKRIAKIDPLICRGCGTCSAICPTGATKLANYDRDLLFTKIEGITRNFYKSNIKKPLIISLTCKECAYCGVDLASMSNFTYPANVFLIDIPCAGRIGPIDILKTFVEGADAVLVVRCPEKSCHYKFGNKNAELVTNFTKDILNEIGIDGRRLKLLELISAEPDKFGQAVADMNELIKEIGRNPSFKRS